jgi:transcription elongation factor Elf1
MHKATFKCPHCGHQMTTQAAPFFTPVPSPGQTNGVAVIFSCTNCEAALGAAWTPAP